MKEFKDNHLYYLPLGGVGIFGANCYLYRYAGKWIMIDCGLAFNKNQLKYPGVDIMFPDISFVEKIKDDLLAIVCTHGHEDHIGAIPYICGDLTCPIYGSKFTCQMLDKKLGYKRAGGDKRITEVKPYSSINLGKFELDFMPVIHSIPGAMSVRIKAGGKTVIHAGDWRLDDDPMLEFSDEKQWKIAGKEGVDAFVCDSTDFGDFEEGQEKELVKPLARIFSRTKGCAFVAIFSTNIARVEVIIRAARKAGRVVGLVGTSLVANAEIAEKCKLLNYEFLTIDDMSSIPKDEMVIVMTGSQGQQNSGLIKLSSSRLSYIDLDEDDTVILSSRAIPGNEYEIHKMIDRIKSYGATVITSEDEFVHVSGHSSPKNVEQMYKWVKPNTLIAMHGEEKQLQANVDFANKMKIENALIVNNGDVYDFHEKEIVNKISTGLVCSNHGVIIPMNSSSLSEKKRIIFNGACLTSVVLNKENGTLDKLPQITLIGLDNHKVASQKIIAERVYENLKELENLDEARIKSVVKNIMKDLFNTEKPLIEVHIFKH